MMPVPATLTSYLPVLLHSVTNHGPQAPDDSSYSIQPEGQVDYLSHEWREEDVWSSWRSMTRQKNAIANGMRLENASWRTWWKQRNKLPTVSPETLNWLKDSDVTWLYGPLHVGHDWSKPAHIEPPPSPAAQRRNSMVSGRSSGGATGKKPILKRRSISQLLSLPESPFFNHDVSEESEEEDASHVGDDEEPPRPPLLHTKSDTHISWRSRPFRKTSPPRIIAPDHSPTDGYFPNTTGTTSSEASNSTGSSQDLSTASTSGAEGSGGKKKHISFNTFVEQCIAIEKPKSKRKGSIHFYTDPIYDESYDEDSEVGEEEPEDPQSFYVEESSGMASDSDDEDEDDVLEMRSSRSRSSSTSSWSGPPVMRTTSPPSTSSSSSRRPPLVRQNSMDRERVTIAPIAPTLLKTSGVGNHLVTIGEDRLMPQKEVELVYVPPSNSIYSLPGTPNLGAEDVYHHRESYFTVGTVGTDRQPIQSRSADSSPVLVTSSLPRDPQRQSSHGNLQQFFAPQQSLYGSPMVTDDIREEDAYDYFGGSDFGEEYTARRHTSRLRRSSSDTRTEDPEGGVVRYAQGGASSVPTGRSSDRWSSPISASPKIVVNEVAGAEEEREEISTGSSESPQESAHELPIPRKPDTRIEDDIPLAVSYISNSPAIPVPVPRIATHSSSPPESGFLSPTEASILTRGRSPACSPVSGSTTTGSYSYSSDSRSESRGRSSTRNSSYSDRERSSSRGTNSPIGSISPTGSAIGIGAVQGRGRDSRTSAKMYRREEDRGRDRTGRRIGDSLSPPSMVGSPSRSVSDDFPPYSPILEKSVLSTSPASIIGSVSGSINGSVSGSSVSGSSTASAATAATVSPPKAEDQEEDRRGRNSYSSYPRPSHIPIPSPIPEEEETRSRQPTPANSPVRALSSPVHTPPTAHAPSPKSRPSAPVTSPSEAQATPSSPTTPSMPKSQKIRSSSVEPTQTGTLVARAAEMVSSARGLLGAIWNAV